MRATAGSFIWLITWIIWADLLPLSCHRVVTELFVAVYLVVMSLWSCFQILIAVATIDDARLALSFMAAPRTEFTSPNSNFSYGESGWWIK